MRRIKVLLLGLVLLTGGCRTLRTVGDVVVAGAVVAGAVLLHHHAYHHHGGYDHGHGRYYRR